MIKKTFFILLLVSFFVSCGSNSMMQKVKRLELGMTKKEATSILGSGYRVLAARLTPDGKVEIIRYEPLIEPGYMLQFLDGNLIEWHEELPEPEPHQHRGGER